MGYLMQLQVVLLIGIGFYSCYTSSAFTGPPSLMNNRERNSPFVSSRTVYFSGTNQQPPYQPPFTPTSIAAFLDKYLDSLNPQQRSYEPPPPPPPPQQQQQQVVPPPPPQQQQQLQYQPPPPQQNAQPASDDSYRPGISSAGSYLSALGGANTAPPPPPQTMETKFKPVNQGGDGSGPSFPGLGNFFGGKKKKDEEDSELYKLEDMKNDEEGGDAVIDDAYMQLAVALAETEGGEQGRLSAFPRPTVGAILATSDGTIIGEGNSNYKKDAIISALKIAGLEMQVVQNDWDVSSTLQEVKDLIAGSTLYVTLEPSSLPRGEFFPPLTRLIELSGIARVVIGAADPAPEFQIKGAKALQKAGVKVNLGTYQKDKCQDLLSDYKELSNSQLREMARKNVLQYGRPLGLFHCSVVGAAPEQLSRKDFGSYEITPPMNEGVDLLMDFVSKTQEDVSAIPQQAWYEQADAVIAEIPPQDKGPPRFKSITGRLAGLKWLATDGDQLPAGVEVFLVLDANDLVDVPLKNGDPNLPAKGLEIETFWMGIDRKPPRILLTRNSPAQVGELRRKFQQKGIPVEYVEGSTPIDVMNYLGKRYGFQTVVWRAGSWGDRGESAISGGAFQLALVSSKS